MFFFHFFLRFIYLLISINQLFRYKIYFQFFFDIIRSHFHRAGGVSFIHRCSFGSEPKIFVGEMFLYSQS